MRPFERLKARLRPSRAYEANTRTDPTPRNQARGMAHCRNRQTSFFRNGSASFSRRFSKKKISAFDREGRPRTAYSLRHTYICLRLMEGADIYQIAKNCRTSVEMIEKYYAAHIKTNLDAAAINIMRPKPKKKQKPAEDTEPTGPAESRKLTCKFALPAL